jgi:nucleotide-binding universal stress UspA family protein
VRNPLRDEGAAFRLVLLSIGYFGLIVLASWINVWLGVAVFVVLTVAAVLALRGGRQRPEVQHVQHPPLDPTYRVLVIANETVGGRELLELVRARVAGGRADVRLVCPALNSRVRTWMSDEDGAREAAQERLEASLAQLSAAGVEATGEIGDGDPVQAIEDALRAFPADELIVSTHPPGRSNWVERGVVTSVRERFDVPLTHVVVDLAAQAPSTRTA